MTTASTPRRVPFKENTILKVLLSWYLAFWAAMGLMPMDRPTWMLLNLLPVLFVTGLVLTHRSFPLSDTSYLLITIFLTLHAIGSHYTYAKVPVGFWLSQVLDLQRNHFDRIVHFGFGFLFVYPLREVLIRAARVEGFWAHCLAVNVVMAFAGMWEVIESWTARIVRPEIGTAFLGSQGDVWDAQKDIAAALYGSLLCIGLVLVAQSVLREDEEEGDTSNKSGLEAALGD
jgi:putative membrane protein